MSTICNEGETVAQNSTVLLPPQDALVTTPTTSTQLIDITRLAHALEQFASDEDVLKPNSLAKYAVALFKMSRSSVTRLSSARSLRSSAC